MPISIEQSSNAENNTSNTPNASNTSNVPNISTGVYTIQARPFKTTKLHLCRDQNNQKLFCLYQYAENMTELIHMIAELSKHFTLQSHETKCAHLMLYVNCIKTETGDRVLVFRVDVPIQRFCTLRDMLLNNPQGIPEHIARMIFLQILRAVIHCNEVGVIINVLTPDNILVFSQEPNTADNGMATTTSPYHVVLTDLSQSMSVESQNGIHHYIAPEMNMMPVDAVNWNATNMWSLGVIFYELLTGSYPWPASTTPSELNALAPLVDILRTTPIGTTTRGAVVSLLQRDVGLRPSSRECLDQFFFVPRPFSILDPLPPAIASALASEHTAMPSPLLLGEELLEGGIRPPGTSSCLVCQRVFQHYVLARRHYDRMHGGVITSTSFHPVQLGPQDSANLDPSCG